MKRHEEFLQQAKAAAERREYVGDTEARIQEALDAGFVVSAKVRMKGDPEIGEITGYDRSGNDLKRIKVKFERGEFPYSVNDLELVEK